MRFYSFLILGLLILIPLVSGLDTSKFDFEYETPINYSLVATVNATEWWVTDEGNLDNVVDILGSWITNDLGWITNAVSNLINYYSKIEINSIVSGNKTIDTNATTECGDNSYLRGDGTCQDLATTYYNATQSEAIKGTVDGGTLVDTQHPDGDYDGITFNFSEEAGAIGLDLRVNFTGVTDFNKGYMRYMTSSLSGDYAVVQLWSYDDNAWEGVYGEISESSNDFFTLSGDVLDSTEHIQDGVVQMRLYKEANGNKNNHYYVDMLAIVDGYATPSGNVDLTPYWRYEDYDEDRNFTTEGNIYADNFIGSGAQLTNLNVTGVMNVSGDFTGYEINVSYLSGANGIGGIDMRGDPWYFSGADFQIVENLIVDNNVTADWGFFKNINATKLFIGNIDVSQVIEDLDGNVYVKNNTSGWNMSFTNDIDFNVNSSLSLNSSEGYIKEMNYTIFDLILNVLTIDESWLTTFWDAIFGTKSTDDLTEGSTNKYDNQSWNESYANNIYYKNGDDANFTSMNTTTININEIEGACDLNKNHSICSNATGTYIIG